MIQVGFKVLIGRIPFLRVSNLQNFVGASHIRSAPSQRKSYPTLVYWHFVIVGRAVWFFYNHLLASSDLHLLALFPEEGAR